MIFCLDNIVQHARSTVVKAISVVLTLTLLMGNGVEGTTQKVILYEDYHYKGASELVNFESCQNVPTTFNDKASSLNTNGECIRLYENRCCQGRSIELPAGSPLTEDLYNAEFDKVVSSISPCGNYSSPQPPYLLKESFLNHTDLLTMKFSDEDIAIYFDSNVSQSVKWPEKFVGDAWRYLKRNYNLDQIAGLTRNEKLHVIFHSGKDFDRESHYSTSSALTYFDASSECRNIIDISSSTSVIGRDSSGEQLDAISQELGNMVIYLYRGGKYAPTFLHLDKNDAEFVKIITFDMYRGLNLSKEQDRFFQKALTSRAPGSADIQKKQVSWFKDWYFPIYKKYGELHVIRKYLKLSAAYYPTVSATRHFNVTEQVGTLKMNLGEFVHFWSGVTHENLQTQAIKAFGWTMLNEYQLIQAQKDFPKLSY